VGWLVRQTSGTHQRGDGVAGALVLEALLVMTLRLTPEGVAQAHGSAQG
jgi:hypothetical protein